MNVEIIETERNIAIVGSDGKTGVLKISRILTLKHDGNISSLGKNGFLKNIKIFNNDGNIGSIEKNGRIDNNKIIFYNFDSLDILGSPDIFRQSRLSRQL